VKPKLYYRNKKEDPAQRFQIPQNQTKPRPLTDINQVNWLIWLNIEIVITSFLVPKMEKGVTK
jgi:hypothetical protein